MMLGVIRSTKNFTRFRTVRLFVCYQSTKPVCEEKPISEINKPKKYAKAEKVRELKPFKQDFVCDLFGNVFDKSIFKYPEVVKDDEIDLLLTHATEVEEYVNNPNIKKGKLTKTLLHELQQLELFGLSIPPKYGGLGYSETETKFIQECSGVSHKIGRLIANNESFGIKVLMEYGSEEQKQKYLPRLASGESLATIAFLENGPLIDITGFNSMSINHPECNGYLINGNKKWVINADISDLIFVLTKWSKVEQTSLHTDLKLFIVEKNTPGVTVYKLKNKNAEEFGLHEVNFENVLVPKNSMIDAEDGFSVLKLALTSSQLSAAVLCLSLIKRIMHDTILELEGKIERKTPVRNQACVEVNMGTLSAYTYALESAIYLVSGRCDTFDKPDLFFESCLTKILATNVLQFAIEKYIQIVGVDSYKTSSILEEALQALQYYTVFDESNEHLKLMVGAAGIASAGRRSYSSVVKRLSDSHAHPLEFLKWNFSSQEQKAGKLMVHNLKMELHGSLRKGGDTLEFLLGKFSSAVKDHLVYFGNKSLDEEGHVLKFAEVAVYLYALTASLSRASTAICDSLKHSENQAKLAIIFSSFAEIQTNAALSEITNYTGCYPLYSLIGKMAFENKEYPAEHPLARSW